MGDEQNHQFALIQLKKINSIALRKQLDETKLREVEDYLEP